MTRETDTDPRPGARDRAFERLLEPARAPAMPPAAKAALKSRILQAVADEQGTQTVAAERPPQDNVVAIDFSRSKAASAALEPLPQTRAPSHRRAGVRRSGPYAAMIAASLVLGISLGASATGSDVASGLISATSAFVVSAAEPEQPSLFGDLLNEPVDSVF